MLEASLSNSSGSSAKVLAYTCARGVPSEVVFLPVNGQISDFVADAGNLIVVRQT